MWRNLRDDYKSLEIHAFRVKRILLALVLTILLGIASRTIQVGWSVWDKHLGDVLYAVVVYLCVVIVTKARAFPTAFGIAALICLGVELFKLTGIPMAMRGVLISRWVLGTTFSLHNLPLYLIGLATIASIDRLSLRRLSV